MENSVAILINSCDAYVDVVRLNLCALKEFWPNMNYPIYLNTESACLSSDLFEIRNLNAKNPENYNWGSRFRNSLLNIKEEYVIVILDDFILEHEIDVNTLYDVILKMKSNTNIDCFYLEYAKHNIIFDNEIGLHRLLNNNYYLVNTGPALWRRKSLLDLVRPGDNPWVWEFFSMYRNSARGLNIFGVPSELDNVYKYDSRMGGAIYRGKWVYDVVINKLAKYDLDINLNEKGVIHENESFQRSFMWKLHFIVLGYKMVGINSFHALFHFIRVKVFKKPLV